MVHCSADAKVAEPGFTVHAHEDVGGLDVPVHLPQEAQKSNTHSQDETLQLLTIHTQCVRPPFGAALCLLWGFCGAYTCKQAWHAAAKQQVGKCAARLTMCLACMNTRPCSSLPVMTASTSSGMRPSCRTVATQTTPSHHRQASTSL